MRTFFTSDTHFGHANIIKYCNRPFSDVNEMDEQLVAKWNEIVREDDIVWHLGDFSFQNLETIKNFVNRLNGKIKLVLGNHDLHSVKEYLFECGFESVYDHPVLIDNFFILSHEPIQWLKEDCPMFNIFGHVHNNPAFKDFSTNSFCVCPERCNYAPISFQEIISKTKI